MALILQRPWDSQPQEAVALSALLPKSTRAWLPGQCLEISTGAAAVLDGSARSVTPYGVSAKYNGTVSSRTHFEPPASSGNLTLVFVGQIGSTSGVLTGVFGNGTQAAGHYISIESGSTLSVVSTEINNWTVASGPVVSVGQLIIAVVVFTSGGGRKLFLNGRQVASGALARTPTGLDRWVTGCYYGGSSAGYSSAITGDASLSAAIPSALSDSEASDLSLNPWQIFQPLCIYIPGAVVGGGDASTTLANAAATSAAGTLSATGSADVSLTGASATAGAGAVSAFALIDVALPSASATIAAGVLVGTGTAVTALTGAAATASAGTVSASASSGGDASVSLTGAAAVVAAGTITVTGTAVVLLSEAGATMGAGTMSASDGSTPARKLDNWYYRPALIPFNAEAWLVRELNTISRSTYGAAPFVQMVDVAVEPEKPNPGMVVFTTATAWNPGSGAGVYCYRSGAWHLLG